VRENESTVTFEDCEAIAESPKAILVKFGDDGPEGEAWIPKSQIHEDSEVFEAATSGTLIVSEWLAKQKGWGGANTTAARRTSWGRVPGTPSVPAGGDRTPCWMNRRRGWHWRNTTAR